MDTRLRKFKYSFFTKLLCWLIAITFFCLSFTVAVNVIIGCYVMGPTNYFEGKKTDYYETTPFSTQFHSDVYDAVEIGRVNSKEFKKYADAEKDSIVDEVLKAYLVERGSLIEKELTYAVDNWDTEYYAYEDEVVEATVAAQNNTAQTTAVSVEIPAVKLDATEPALTLPADADEYISVPDYAPKNIKLASYALNTTSNTAGYNKYAGLVRESAFEAQSGYGEFYTSRKVDITDYNGGYFDVQFSSYYTLDEAEAKAEFQKQYDDAASYALTEDEFVLSGKNHLEERENLKYFIVDFDGNVFSNIDEIPANLSSCERYILANEDNVTIKGFAFDYIENCLKDIKVKKLCVYFDETFEGDDVYSNIYKTYNAVTSHNANKLVVELAVLLVLFIVFLVIWLRLVGNRADFDKPVTCFVEKLPNDLHTAISVGAIWGLIYLYVETAYYFSSLIFPITEDVVFGGVILALCLIVFTEWLASVVRTKKAGESWFKNTVIFMTLKGIVRLFKFLINKVFKKLVKAFSYKPKAYKIRFILLFAGYVLVNILLGSVAIISSFNDGVFLIISALFFLVFNSFVGYLVVKYVNNLDKIIAASSEHEDVVFTDKKIPASLQLLADNLSDKNAAIDKAVAEAVKNEQMKTQLITNVSHDLKTPLTSLISYSDLLTKCEVEDEDAKKYIDVINQQSVKLKRLIEDLIEASKVSTGNVTLNKIRLNLSELAVQAIVEFTPDFENNRNEIKFTEPATAPIVFADGNKTYRIISNLLSNAKKYSASDTRVYASVYNEGDFGCFEIKNISKEPLNISPEQLTERFVRGDESRSKEGNGLGLSIAKDLCELQGGALEIKIDGDLFKVIVKLPVTK